MPRAGRLRLLIPVVLAVLALAAPAATAEPFQQAQERIDQRLEGALRELARVREEIAAEKIPLSKALAGLEEEVLGLRRERDRLLKIRDSRSIDLASLRKQVESLEGQDEFIESRLGEFARDFETRLDISELPLYEGLTGTALLADRNAGLDAGGKRDARLAVVRAALGRLHEQLGGRIFAGEALGPDGVLTEGRFVALGPTVFYADREGRVTGLVENRLNAADPVVVALPGGLGRGIAELASSGSGKLPFDATLGKAIRTEKARKSLVQYARDGGAVGYVIIALGIAALLLTAFKAYEILTFPSAPPEQVDVILDHLADGDAVAAARQAQQVEGVAGEILVAGLQNRQQKRGVLEELLFEKILGVRPMLERYLPFLAITAAAAPLLGLLGTVVGMIKTFQLITIFGTGDAKSLSSGISEALVTTALGLIVAIPTLILHGALSRMAKRKLGLLEQLAVALVNGIWSLRTGDDQKPLEPTAKVS